MSYNIILDIDITRNNFGTIVDIAKISHPPGIKPRPAPLPRLRRAYSKPLSWGYGRGEKLQAAGPGSVTGPAVGIPQTPGPLPPVRQDHLVGEREDVVISFVQHLEVVICRSAGQHIETEPCWV